MKLNTVSLITSFLLATLVPFSSQADKPDKQYYCQSIYPGEQSRYCVNLNGDWSLNGFDPEGTRRISNISARVPGQVHIALQRAGLIADPFWRDQADLCQWVEHWEWRYSRTFTIPPGFPRKWAVLQFDGLDTFATIFLNGRQLGRADNMFIPHEYEVSKWLREGKNTIEVRFAPPVAAVSDKPYHHQSAAFDPTGARTYIRRMQCGFGWDWVPRLVSAGIWRSCRVIAFPGVRINDLFAWTSSLNHREAALRIKVSTTLRDGNTPQLRVVVLDPDGQKVWQKNFTSKSGSTEMVAHIKRPEWWWPNGLGSHPLYLVKAELLASDGRIVQQVSRKIGLRTVSLEQRPDKDGSGKSFTFVVNGTRIFAKGANWVPADPFPSRITAEKYDRLISQAKDAGVNILRAWGGGIYERKPFWEACDRMGIMVWQDFLLACANYPENDPTFTGPLKKEFASAVRLLRNHPSLVCWCGGNELGENSDPRKHWNMKNFELKVAAPLVHALDPSRPFRPTSPYGGRDINNSPDAGDCHLNAQMQKSETMIADGMRNYRQIIQERCGRYMSEQAAGGSPPKRVLLRFMTENDLAGTKMWEYHTRDNPYGKHTFGLTLNHMFEREASLLYGSPGNDADRRIRQEGYLQYEFVRLGLEAARRRKFWCSGIQYWMFNNCWPATGWSMLDYWGGRKAAWYALASGCRPIIAAQQVTTNAIRWWVCSGLLQPEEVSLKIRVQPWEGPARWSEQIKLKVPANCSTNAVEIPLAKIKGIMGKDSALVCDLACSADEDRSWWFPGLPREMKLLPAKLHVTQQRGQGEGTITIHTDNWARVVTLHGDVDFSDNYFELMPGETRTITWKSPDRYFAGKIRVTCWNQ